MLEAVKTSLWQRWVAANVVGTVVGLGITLMVGYIAYAGLGAGLGALGVVLGGAVISATGLVYGTAVGLAQWWAMRPAFERMDDGLWWGATLVGALVTWTMGTLPYTLLRLAPAPATSRSPLRLGAVLLLAAGIGAVLGPLLALMQWLVLRQTVTGAARWLLAHSLAWALGLPLVLAGLNLARNASSLTVAIGMLVVALALTGTVVGAVTGVTLVSLAQPDERIPLP